MSSQLKRAAPNVVRSAPLVVGNSVTMAMAAVAIGTVAVGKTVGAAVMAVTGAACAHALHNKSRLDIHHNNWRSFQDGCRDEWHLSVFWDD